MKLMKQVNKAYFGLGRKLFRGYCLNKAYNPLLWLLSIYINNIYKLYTKDLYSSSYTDMDINNKED